MNQTSSTSLCAAPAWQQAVFKVLKEGGVKQIAYVPDAGHAHAIRCAINDPEIEDIVLTTEEEGVEPCFSCKAAALAIASICSRCYKRVTFRF
jgi:sulfopyruvate decarboxylase TPP-binding subunit